jgi:predicted nucleic acid-binding protein
VKAFFDTSVLVAVFLEDHEHHERSFSRFVNVDRSNGCCAAHSLAEVYATLTRMPGKFRLSTDQILLFLDTVEERLEIVALDGRDYRLAIEAAATAGITGGTTYDVLLTWCARKAQAEKIYTWNIGHFRSLGTDIARGVQTP